MSVITYAVNANAALLLPTLLIADYLDQTATSKTTHIFKDDEALEPGVVLELRSDDSEEVLRGDAVVDYLIKKSGLLPIEIQVKEWLDRTRAHGVTDLTVLNYAKLDRSMAELDAHLTLRSYIVGYSLTVADLAIWGSLRANKIAPTVFKKSGPMNTTRWFNFIQETNPWIQASVAKLQATAQKKRAAASAAGGNYDIGLENGENGIHTRFPPEPSGYLHIGHVKAALLNDYYAHRTTTGSLLCRFDDTNPSKEKQEFEDAIIHDLARLGIYPDKMSHSSDYFELMHKKCLQMLTEGKAYADCTDKSTMKVQRDDGIPSAWRDESVEDNLVRFEEMATGSEEGARWCVRAKISIDNPNKAMRDPVIYRCNSEPHHRTGTMWKVYPTYDFCAPILDSIEGITHALRTNEYRDRNPQYAWMQNALGIRNVVIWDFARVNFMRTVLSKRKLTKLVDSGIVSGWDDPRMPTVQGILRHGMVKDALREFIIKQGPSSNIINMDWNQIWAINRKHIDPVSPRCTAVNVENIVEASVAGALEMAYDEDKPKHAKNPNLGTKKVTFSKSIVLEQDDAKTFQQDEEITLMNWGNAFVRKIHMNNGIVSTLELELHLQGDVKKTDKKVTWLSKEGQQLIPVQTVSFDHLITKDKLEKIDDIFEFLTPQTEFHTKVLADSNIANLLEGDIIQFERKGFYRVDKPFVGGEDAVLFAIPGNKGK